MTGRITLLTCLGVAVAASAADPETRLRFQKDVDRIEASGDEIVAAPLDDEVYAVARDGFPDLRIIDDRNVEVPFVIETISRPRRTSVAREPCPAKVDTLHVEEGEALEVVVALDEHAKSADGATIRTPLTDFERRVRVYGDRGGEWTLLNDDGRIFDYTRFMNVRNPDVALAANGFRRYKFVVEQEQDERESPFRELVRDRGRGVETEIATVLRRPFRIDRIELWRDVEHEGGEEEATFSYPITGLHVETDARRKVTRVVVKTGWQPLNGLRLETSSRNFSRPARVVVPVDRKGRDAWVEVGRGTLALFAFRGFRREDLTIDFGERRADRYRLVIENADNPPIDVTGIEGKGTGRQVVFLGESGRTYRLFYGSDALEAPRYDAATVLDVIGRGRSRSVAKLGPQVRSAGYRQAGDRPRRLDGGVFLALAIVVMVAVLAWALIGADRRLKKLPLDDFGG
jgi:hypothetical protein